MADATLLSILAGTDPQAAQMLAAGQGIQLGNAALDPAFGHNEGPLGALAKTIAGVRGSGMLNNAAQQIIPARQAALPELAQVYASEDPLKAVASGNYSPQTLSMALAGVNPLNAAQAREAAANAALGNLNVRGFQAAQGAPGASNGISAPASRGMAPPMGPMTSGPPVSGRPAQEPIQGAGNAMPSDPVIAAASMSPQQRQQLIANPQARALLLQRLRALQALHAQQSAANPGVPSLGPTPPPT